MRLQNLFCVIMVIVVFFVLLLYLMLSVPLPGQWLHDLHQLGWRDQVKPGVGCSCIVLKRTWKQSPRISAPFEITSEKAPSYGFSAWSWSIEDLCWIQEDMSAYAGSWGVGVKSQGQRYPQAWESLWSCWKTEGGKRGMKLTSQRTMALLVSSCPIHCYGWVSLCAWGMFNCICFTAHLCALDMD